METFCVQMPHTFEVGDSRKAFWPAAPDFMDSSRVVTWRDQDTLVTDRGEAAKIVSIEKDFLTVFTCELK